MTKHWQNIWVKISGLELSNRVAYKNVYFAKVPHWTHSVFSKIGCVLVRPPVIPSASHKSSPPSSDRLTLLFCMNLASMDTNKYYKGISKTPLARE